ncbi:MAG: hypothetical protein IJ944_02795 [Clostridia bacterium]|nr:hypothetical protein [Clostridia bacterium]
MQRLLLDKVLNPIAKLYEGLSNKTRDVIFVVCFSLLLLYNVFKSLIADFVPYLSVYIFGCICILVAVFAVMRPNMQPVKFLKIPLTMWLIGSGIICITSIIHNTDWLSEAFLMLVLCPLMYIVLGNLDYKHILRLLSRAVVISFVLHMIFSALLVPVEDRQYAGLFNNVNGAGQYLVLVFACLLIECMRKHHRKWVGVLNFILFGMCSALIFYTNSRTGLLSALAALFLIGFLYIVREWRKNKKEVSLRVLSMILSIAVMLPTTIYLFRGCYNATGWFREIASFISVSDTDVDNKGGFGSFFEYAKLKTEIADKDMDAISTGRTAIWKAYLSHSSFFGSDVEESFFVESRNSNYSTAHMVWITYAFRHGYICSAILLLYSIIMFFVSLAFAWKRKGDPWSFLPLAITVVFMVTALVASINTPYSYMLTICYYFIQTWLIAKGVKKGSQENEETISEN